MADSTNTDEPDTNEQDPVVDEETARELLNDDDTDMSETVREELEDLISERSEESQQERDIAPSGGNVRVTRDYNEQEAVMARETLGLIVNARNPRQAQDHAERLIRGGHYGRDVTEQARASGDFYSTVVDADGGLLLPTQVRDQIEEIADQVGVAREIVDTFEQIEGTIRVPAATGVEDQADFVAEGGTITSNKRAFQSVELNPQKVAQIVPWTYEAQVELAPQILSDVQRAIARSFARAEDDALLNGDGSSSYNSIDGLFSSNKSVPTFTIGSGADTAEDPANITPEELILARNEVDPGARMLPDLYYVFHPDMRNVFLTKKDDNGDFLFEEDFREGGDDADQIRSVEVLFTEVLPQPGSSQPSTKFGTLVNGMYVKMATGQGISTEELRTGTVQDADTGADINLATQDLRALKARRFFDLDFNFDQAAVNFETSTTT